MGSNLGPMKCFRRPPRGGGVYFFRKQQMSLNDYYTSEGSLINATRSVGIVSKLSMTVRNKMYSSINIVS